MSNAGSYDRLLLPYGRQYYGRGARTAAVAPDADDSAIPSIPAIFTAIYLTSVPMLSYSETLRLSWVPQVIGVATAVAWLVFGLLMRGQRMIWPATISFYILWAVWSGSGILVTINSDYFTNRLSTILKVVAMTWVTTQCVRRRNELLLGFMLVSFAAIVIFFLGVDNILKTATYSGSKVLVGSRAGETLVANPNDLGQLGFIVAMLDITGFMVLRKKILKLLSLSSLPCALYIIMASGSRMAMVSVVLIGFGLYWFHFRKTKNVTGGKRWVMAGMGLAVVGGSIFFLTKVPLLFRLTQTLTNAEVAKDEPRFRYFISGMQATIQNPVFGLGIGGFALAGLGGDAKSYHYSHSTVTETLCCTGLPGFALYFASHGFFILSLRKLRKVKMPDADRTLVDMIMVLAIVIVFCNVVSIMYENRLLWPLYGAICGYLNSLRVKYLKPAHAAGYVRR